VRNASLCRKNFQNKPTNVSGNVLSNLVQTGKQYQSSSLKHNLAHDTISMRLILIVSSLAAPRPARDINLLSDQLHNLRFELPGGAGVAEAGVERHRECKGVPEEARRVPNLRSFLCARRPPRWQHCSQSRLSSKIYRLDLKRRKKRSIEKNQTKSRPDFCSSRQRRDKQPPARPRHKIEAS
jgi:hypothetical protein